MASFIPPENRKPEEVALVSLFLTLNIFHTFPTVSSVDFEHVFVC